MIDDAFDVPDGKVLTAQICIIGAGAAGITLALELAETGIEVLLLEAGGSRSERSSQKLYEGGVTDERLHSPPHRYRQRRFGGTTSIWGGRCVPFDAIDFETREYMPGSGWPLTRDALLPFYRRANDLCEAGEFEYRASAAFSRALRPMIEGFQSTNFSVDSLERFSCPTDFGARYGDTLRGSKSIRVLLHANVTRFGLYPGGQGVESVTVCTLRGRRFTVRASHFVVAAGGLEVPRLLLASRETSPNGIGNDHDVLGRYYMCHIAGTIGNLRFNRSGEGVWHDYDRLPDGVYCRRRLALTPDAQRRLQIGNFIARLHHPVITDPSHRTAVLSALQLAKRFISYEYGKRLHGEEATSLRTGVAHLLNVLSDPMDVASFGYHMLREHFLAKRKFPSVIVRSKAGNYSLDFHAEQQPNDSSRIRLADERDALGVPRLVVDWHYTSKDVETVRTAIQLLAEDIRRSGVGTFDYDPDSVESEMLRYGAYGGHHLGTARMGTDRRTSVVDPYCRVHGIANLYVAGGAVFPTSSQANPTLTIVALAVRLAGHLRRVEEEGRVPEIANEGTRSLGEALAASSSAVA